MIATLTLKRMTDNEIIQQIQRQTGQTITRNGIYKIRQQIKKESYDWYNTLRQDQFAYIHEFAERINEIMSLQKKHHEIINSDKEPTQVKQASLAELHRLSITLSNLYDVAPSIVNGVTLPTTSEDKADNTTEITV